MTWAQYLAMSEDDKKEFWKTDYPAMTDKEKETFWATYDKQSESDYKINGFSDEITMEKQNDIEPAKLVLWIYQKEREKCKGSIGDLIDLLAKDPKCHWNPITPSIAADPEYAGKITALGEYFTNNGITPAALAPDSEAFKELERKAALKRRLDVAIQEAREKIEQAYLEPKKRKRRRIIKDFYGKSVNSAVMKQTELFNIYQKKLQKLSEKLADLNAKKGKSSGKSLRGDHYERRILVMRNKRIRASARQNIYMLSVALKQQKYMNKASKYEAKSYKYAAGSRKQRKYAEKIAEIDKKLKKPVKKHGARIFLAKQGLIAFCKGKKKGDLSSWETRRADALRSKLHSRT